MGQLLHDNQYVVFTIEKKWYKKWQDQGWLGRKNKKIWKRVLKEIKKFPKGNVKLVWVKGH